MKASVKMHYRQSGTALILSMVFLLLLTILGLSSVRTTILEEKMTSNMRDQQIAFEAAETGLREGEKWLESQKSQPNTKSSTGGFVYAQNKLTDLTQKDGSWWNNTNTEQAATTLTTVKSQPRFVLEERGFIADSLVRGYDPAKGRMLYRVAARGTGMSDSSQSMVESTQAIRFN